MMTNMEPTSPASQATRVAHELLRRIQDEELKVGDRLPSERNLAEELEVSRPVVREALRTLAAFDLVDVQVGRGAFVSSGWEGPSPFTEPSPDDLLDVIDAREVLEHGALRLGSARATRRDSQKVRRIVDELQKAVRAGRETDELDFQLHSEIVRCSHSTALIRMWSDLDGRIRRSVRFSPHGLKMSEELLRLHCLLADGILENRLDDAIQASATMCDENRQFLISALNGKGRRRT